MQVRDRLVGLIVDTAREFLRINKDAIRPIQETLTGISGNYLRSVANVNQRLILLLDLDAVLDVERYEPAADAAFSGAKETNQEAYYEKKEPLQ